MPRKVPLFSSCIPAVIAGLVHLHPAMDCVAQGRREHHQRVIVGMKFHIVQGVAGPTALSAAIVTEPPLPNTGTNEDG